MPAARDGRPTDCGPPLDADHGGVLVVALVDVAAVDGFEAVQAETFDGVAGGDGAEDQGFADLVEAAGVGFALVGGAGGGEAAHDAACEAVACAGGVNDVFGGVSGQAGDAVFVDEDTAVFAFLDDDEARAHGEDVAGGGDGIFLACEQFGFIVVESQAIDVLEQRQQLGLGDVDPQVHGVGDDQLALGEAGEEAVLHGGVGVA